MCFYGASFIDWCTFRSRFCFRFNLALDKHYRWAWLLSCEKCLTVWIWYLKQHNQTNRCSLQMEWSCYLISDQSAQYLKGDELKPFRPLPGPLRPLWENMQHTQTHTHTKEWGNKRLKAEECVSSRMGWDHTSRVGWGKKRASEHICERSREGQKRPRTKLRLFPSGVNRRRGTGSSGEQGRVVCSLRTLWAQK